MSVQLQQEYAGVVNLKLRWDIYGELYQLRKNLEESKQSP